MRDLRLTFWSTTFGGIGMLFLVASRILSFVISSRGELFAGIPGTVNFLVSLLALAAFFKAVRCAIAANRELNVTNSILYFVQYALLLDMAYQLFAQLYRFIIGQHLQLNAAFTVIIILLSLPSLLGLICFYTYKELRTKAKYLPLVLSILSAVCIVFRIGEVVVLPMLSQAKVLEQQTIEALMGITGINVYISFGINIAVIIILVCFAVFCGKTVKKMPEKNSFR